MPIPFQCPHCGAFTEVDDVYAGHTGPCATCNRPITIPYIPAAMSVPATSTAAVAARPATRLRGWLPLLLLVAGGALAVILLLALGMVLLRPAVQAARSLTQKNQCSRNLERIGLALRAYHDENGSYPPAYLVGPDGKPMHSWRVLILPYLGDQAKSVYQQYDFRQAWDSDHNMRLASYMPDVYGCPEHPDALPSQETTYMVIVGPKTMFPGKESVSDDDIGDRAEHTIMVVETAQSGVHWLKPQDLEAARMAFEVNQRMETELGSYHPQAGAHVLTADGKTHFLSDDFTPEWLSSMSTINGGEPIPENAFRN